MKLKQDNKAIFNISRNNTEGIVSHYLFQYVSYTLGKDFYHYYSYGNNIQLNRLLEYSDILNEYSDIDIFITGIEINKINSKYIYEFLKTIDSKSIKRIVILYENRSKYLNELLDNIKVLENKVIFRKSINMYSDLYYTIEKYYSPYNIILPDLFKDMNSESKDYKVITAMRYCISYSTVLSIISPLMPNNIFSKEDLRKLPIYAKAIMYLYNFKDKAKEKIKNNEIQIDKDKGIFFIPNEYLSLYPILFKYNIYIVYALKSFQEHGITLYSFNTNGQKQMKALIQKIKSADVFIEENDIFINIKVPPCNTIKDLNKSYLTILKKIL